MRYLPLLLLLFPLSCVYDLEKVQPTFYEGMEEHGYTNVEVYNRLYYGCAREMHAFEWTATKLGKNFRGRSCCKSMKEFGCSKSYEIRE